MDTFSKYNLIDFIAMLVGSKILIFSLALKLLILLRYQMPLWDS